MKKLIKLEIYKALHNKFFIIIILIGLLVVMFNVLYIGKSYREITYAIEEINTYNGHETNPEIHARTLFNSWIGGESQSLPFSLFFFLFPLFAACPYGWSYFVEKKSGYMKNVITRTSKMKYMISKYIAVFISGGLAVVIPLITNFLMVALIVPAVKPDVSYPYYAINQTCMWSELFCVHPFLYVLGYLLIDFIFCGLIATISMAASFFVNNRLAVVLSPFFLILGIHYSRVFIYGICRVQTSPLYFLHAMPVEEPAKACIILLEGGVIFLFTFCLCIRRGIKNEIL